MILAEFDCANIALAQLSSLCMLSKMYGILLMVEIDFLRSITN